MMREAGSLGRQPGAVFLDKDGTLLEDVPDNVDLGRLCLTAGARAGMELLIGSGYRLIVVTNQGGIAQGRIDEPHFLRLRRYLLEVLPLTDLYYCPHDPAGWVQSYAIPCACRKPAPGLLLRACAEHGIDPGRSWMVSDILDDVEAGRRAGCRTILLNVGHETAWRRSALRRPDHLAPDLGQAARLIVREEKAEASLGFEYGLARGE